MSIAAHKRKKQQKDTSRYPREVVIIEVPEEEKQCRCGCEKKVIRYEIKELYDYQPAVFRIIEQRREVVACPKGCEQSISTAPVPKQVLSKTKATPGLLAHIVVSKLHHRQPLYHLEKYAGACGISRETMSRWLIQLVEPLQPIYNLLQEAVMQYNVASLDATMLQVLREPGRLAHTKSYVYCARGSPKAQPVVIYQYAYQAHKPFVRDWFCDYRGYIHMDADPFFHLLTSDEAVHAVYCHAHARRKFESVAKQAKRQGLAHDALRWYKKLYRIEREVKGLSPEEIYKVRQAKSKPLIEEFKEWLETHLPSLLPKSSLAKAFQYCLNHWEGLARFLEDGRLSIDNNATEREIKPFVMARKNFLFATSIAGAKALCMHMSLIRTALANQVDPYQYYVAVLKALPHCKTVEDYEKLLPWQINLCEQTTSEQ